MKNDFDIGIRIKIFLFVIFFFLIWGIIGVCKGCRDIYINIIIVIVIFLYFVNYLFIKLEIIE